MLRLLPRSRWALLRLGLLAGLTLVVLPPRWWAAQARYTLAFFLKNRLRDRAGVINFADQWRFERFLQQIEDESGADIRVLLVPRVSGESLEMFSVREARAAGVGQGVDRRGLFFVYDAEGHRARIEVGTQLEGIITDAFAGYLIRDHVRSFFGTGSPSFGLRTTLMMVQQRLREAVLGREYDPELLAFIGDARRLAVGGGATGTTQVTQASAFLNRSEPSGRALRRYFGPQPTPQAAYERYLEWLAADAYRPDLPLFTPMTQEWLAETSLSRGMNHHVLTMEYRRSYRILPRGDLALLYFTTDPLVPPHFFRRTPQGWVLDLWTEANDTRNYVGWWYTWAMLNTGDDFAAAFGDRYVDYGGAIRLLGGDNRPLLVKQYPGIRLEPPPEPEDSVADVTVEEGATTIGNAPGVALVVLYPVWSQQAVRELPALTELARRCRDKGAAVLAFTIDHEPGALRYLPDLLRKDHAPFPPMHLTPWRHGGLTGAMAPLGIRIGSEWMPPIVAVRAGTRGVLIQAEGADVFATGMAPFESACGSR